MPSSRGGRPNQLIQGMPSELDRVRYSGCRRWDGGVGVPSVSTQQALKEERAFDEQVGFLGEGVSERAPERSETA